MFPDSMAEQRLKQKTTLTKNILNCIKTDDLG